MSQVSAVHREGLLHLQVAKGPPCPSQMGTELNDLVRIPTTVLILAFQFRPPNISVLSKPSHQPPGLLVETSSSQCSSSRLPESQARLRAPFQPAPIPWMPWSPWCHEANTVQSHAGVETSSHSLSLPWPDITAQGRVPDLPEWDLWEWRAKVSSTKC